MDIALVGRRSLGGRNFLDRHELLGQRAKMQSNTLLDSRNPASSDRCGRPY